MSTETSTRTARLKELPTPQQIAAMYGFSNLTKEWIPIQCTSEGKLAINFYTYVETGVTPIVFAHGIGTTPTGIVATIKGATLEMYAVDADATNITITHSAVGAVTFYVIAWV